MPRKVPHKVKYISFHQCGICGVELETPGYPATSTGNLVDVELVQEHADAMAAVLNIASTEALDPESTLGKAVTQLKALTQKILK